MVDSKENRKFDLGVKGLKKMIMFKIINLVKIVQNVYTVDALC